jgi:hypothetical protein
MPVLSLYWPCRLLPLILLRALANNILHQHRTTSPKTIQPWNSSTRTGKIGLS